MALPLCHRAVTYGSVTYATVGSTSNRAVAALRAFPGLAGLLLAVAGRRRGRERAEEPGGGLGHVVHRPIERRLVGPRRTGGPAQLPDELQGGGPDLLLGGRRVEVGEGPDVPAHARAAADEVVAPHAVQHVAASQPEDDVPAAGARELVRSARAHVGGADAEARRDGGAHGRRDDDGAEERDRDQGATERFHLVFG